MLMLAALGEFPNGFCAAAIRRSSHAIEAHVVRDSCEHFSVLMLAEQHSEVTVAAQVERDKDVLVPEDVDARAGDTKDWVHGMIIKHGPIIERAHPSANTFRGE